MLQDPFKFGKILKNIKPSVDTFCEAIADNDGKN